MFGALVIHKQLPYPLSIYVSTSHDKYNGKASRVQELSTNNLKPQNCTQVLQGDKMFCMSLLSAEHISCPRHHSYHNI